MQFPFRCSLLSPTRRSGGVRRHCSRPPRIGSLVIESGYQAVTTDALAWWWGAFSAPTLHASIAVRRAKHADPYRFAQFLPYFSVKPLYIEALNLVHKAGVGLVRSIAVVSAVSFAGLAALIYWWVLKLGGSVWAACLVLLVSEMSTLAQGAGRTGSRFCFHGRALFALVSEALGWSYVAGIVGMGAPRKCALRHSGSGLSRGQGRAACLDGCRFDRNLGHNTDGNQSFRRLWLEALYSHTFKFTEMDPGLFVPTFTVSDYLHALRSGVREALHSSLVAYLLLWVAGIRLVPRMRWPLLLCGVLSVAKFVIYPNFEPRYYGLLYLVTAIGACAAVQSQASSRGVSQKPASF